MSMLLDLVEVAKSHSGTNLAVAFAKVLEEFGIEDKVPSSIYRTQSLQNWSTKILKTGQHLIVRI